MSVTTPKKNILLIIPNYGFGGAQRVFSQLVNSLSDQYNVIEVVFNNDESDVYNGTGEKLSLNVAGGSTFFGKAANFIKRCWKLYRLKVKYKSKVNISHLEGANYINILSGGPGKKILCVHGSKVAEDSNRRGLIKLIEDKILIPILFNRADKIVTVSHGISKELTRFFKIETDKIQVIQNGIDVDAIKQLAVEEIPDLHKPFFTKPVIIFSGRLAPQKNPLALIDIFNSSKDLVDYNLMIIGDGILKDQMQHRCHQLGLKFYDIESGKNKDARILFLGFQANPFRYLKKSTLFILPSNFEGFPLAPCEALACNLPIMATDCPTGTREILEPDFHHSGEELLNPEFATYGVLMPLLSEANYNHNVDLWSRTVVTMIRDADLAGRYRNQAQERAMQLSHVVFVRRWKELIRYALA